MTNSSDYEWKYEYFYDYIEPVIVDEKKLKFNKYSIVIIFWIGMAAFVLFLFLFLKHLSRPGNQAALWAAGRGRPQGSTGCAVAAPRKASQSS